MPRKTVAKNASLLRYIATSLGNRAGLGYAPAEEPQKPARCARRSMRSMRTRA